MSEYRPRSFQTLPVVIKNILIISGILFLAKIVLQSKFNIDLDDYLGLHYYSASLFRPYQFVTYIFMHGDISHLFFNMLALWMFGASLENLWGPKRFLIFFMVTGLGAALIQYIVFYIEISPVLTAIDQLKSNLTPEAFQSFVNSPEFQKGFTPQVSNEFNSFVEPYNQALSTKPAYAMQLAGNFLHDFKTAFLNAPNIVGASGSLFGILLAFGMLFPNTYLYIYFLFPMKAKYLVAIYGALELFSGISNNPQDNVAHFAHLGGMLFGFIMIMIWKKDRRNFY